MSQKDPERSSLPKPASQLAKELEDRIYRRVIDLDYSAERDVAYKGTRADIALAMPDGGTAIVEVKSWPPDTYAASASAYVDASQRIGQLGAKVVIALDESFGRYLVEAPFVFEGDLPSVLDAMAAGRRPHRKTTPGVTKNPVDIFIAMPFSSEFTDVYFNAMRPAAQTVRARAFRVDYDGDRGDIVREIKARISSCAFVAADITRLRPNVMYEIGLAHAIGKHAVIAAEKDTRIPFDIDHEHVTRYDWNNKNELRRALTREFRKQMRALSLIPPLSGRGR